MGLVIGNTPGILGALTGSSRVRPVTLNDPGDRTRPRLPQKKEEESFKLLGQQEEDTSRIGINSGAASTLAAAFETVKRTVEEVNRNRPSLEDLTIQSQARQARARELFREQLVSRIDTQNQNRPELSIGPSSSREDSRVQTLGRTNTTDDPFASRTQNRVELRLPNPSVQARNFVPSINDSVAEVLERAGTAPTQERSGASFQINGQSFPIGNDGTNRIRFNTTA